MSLFRSLGKLALVVLVLALALLIVPPEIAAQKGCDLHAGATDPCMVWGSDAGPLLRRISAANWMAILAAEIAIGFVLLWVLAALVRRLSRGG
jgi:hypothetical protein